MNEATVPNDVPTYEIQSKFSRLVAIVRRAGLASSMGHDHSIRATEFSGTMTFDATRPERSRVHVQVSVAGLRVDEENVRQEHSLQGSPSKDDVEQTDANMRARDQLDAKRHGHITFRSTSCQLTKQANVYDVAGTLTLRGASQPVRLQVGIVVSNHQLIGTGILRFKQSQFGYKPYSAALGMMKVSDEVELHIRLVGFERDSKAD
jgi:polyisoprenoid-binding protein YceI